MWQTVPETSFSKLVMCPDCMYLILTVVVVYIVVYCLKIYDIILVPSILEYALLLGN